MPSHTPTTAHTLARLPGPRLRARSPRRRAGVCLLGVLLAAGCSRGLSGEDERARVRVSPEQFVSQNGEPAAPLVRDAARGPAAAPEDEPGPGGFGQTARPGPAPTFRVVPGEPVTLADAPRAIEEPKLLDAKVGDINGRPIFASAFLEPIAGRLRANAAEMSRDEWMRSAARIIQDELRGQITDELLRAEALSRLTVEEKAGLRRFLEGVRENLLSQNLGSRELAARRLRSEQGLTEEEYLRQSEERTLVRFTIQEEISDRVNVSWRDIVRRYQRDGEIYNPDPTARYWILRVDAGGEAAQTVRDALASGTPFPELAAGDLNTWTLDEGGARDVPVGEGLDTVRLFTVEELNAPAQSLEPGGTAGPIEFGSSLVWIHLETVSRESVPLYDAQLPIAEQIRSERINLELQRYIDRLLGRASVTDIDRMLVRLLSIATDRFAPPPGPPAGRPAR